MLTISGHDPCGGAGIQADIEAISSHGCHPCSVITTLTEQDSCDIKSVIPLDSNIIIQQIRTLLDDLPIAAVKIGLLSSSEQANALYELFKNSDLPIVYDPVLASGGGTELANKSLIEIIRDKLISISTLITPNSNEARLLIPNIEDLDECGIKLLELGCEQALITGTHETGKKVSNRLYHHKKPLRTFDWDRLPDSYHGSGCTLASSIAALLAHKKPMITAIYEAQKYTWDTLKAGIHPGKGQFFPNRFFWVNRD